MKRFAAGLALSAALLGSTFAGTALAQSYNPQRGQDDSWRQDNNRDRWGQGRFVQTNLEGRWLADKRSMGNTRGNGGFGGMLLPEFIKIDQNRSLVRIMNSRNRTIQEIMVNGRFNTRDRYADHQNHVFGHWRGSTLIVQQTGPRGATITQSFSLENRGRTLVVRTRREGAGPRGTMEFSTVYRKA